MGGEAAEGRAHLVNIESRKAREVQPSVKEHGAMAGTENESIAVDPGAVIGIEVHGMAIKHRTKLSASQGETKMPTGALVHCVHGKTTSFIGSAHELGNRKGLRHFKKRHS